MTIMVTWRHVRAAGYCIHVGARRWCAANGVDFRALMGDGVPVEQIEAIDDEMAQRVAKVARDGIE